MGFMWFRMDMHLSGDLAANITLEQNQALPELND